MDRSDTLCGYNIFIMKQQRRFFYYLRGFSFFVLIFVLGGCSKKERVFENQSSIPSYVPTNHAGIPVLPASVQRVVLLPAFWHQDSSAGFLDDLDLTLTDELNKTNLVEVVPVSRQELSNLFGKWQFATYDVFPSGFFNKLRVQYAADAVIFVDLTSYRAYKPINIGIRAKMVNTLSGESMWAFDTTFDAGDPSIAMGATRYATLRDSSPYPLDASSPILMSPRLFSRYVAFMTFSTLPPR